ncbi:hypothetical protein SAMN05518672_11439 [Chitinophaga sp. CF118]|uniref:hypothetical protein n=1 Tax=Chitinophaga sp. CF118 TaxID=1884367 RepID=UPI0008EBDE05|nr:hypothetical protein [Chitinophaga sp. CF118]SFF01081.1 hypothetical protein SAMN05518672_11439 [Chitinophaga sp. CF118]
MGSFYDLDYMIEINEKRLEQYSGFYQKNMDAFTNIMILYSALAIFIIPIIQSLFFEASDCYWLDYVCFYVFIILFIASLINTALLLMPVDIPYLKEPKTYYKIFRSGNRYESNEKATLNFIIKGAYVDELEESVNTTYNIFRRKALFHYRAFTYAMLSCIPYLFCVGFQISTKKDNVQKVEIINNLSSFNKTKYMDNSQRIYSKRTRTLTDLPGVDSSKVMPSSPNYIRYSLFDFNFNFKFWKRKKKNTEEK